MNNDFNVITVGDRHICIGGVGTMFHQEGFPLGIAAKILAEKGIELSWFHVVKELYFQYTSNDRLFNKLKAEIEDASVEGIKVDLEQLREFIDGDWEKQRAMIFEYLYHSDINLAKATIRNIMSKTP